jgi:adenylate cyclase class 2
MKSEIEAKFLNVNHDEIRAKLQELGAECEQPMRLLRRVTIETPELIAKNGYVRVRDEGDKVTMTYKQFDGLSVDGAKEIEITVNNFDQTVALLDAAGLPHQSFQESKRETWKVGNVEVVLDEWPWIKSYIEIEGETESDLQELAAKLGFDWSQAAFGDVMVAYRAEYPYLTDKDTVGRVAEVKFGDPLPDLLKPHDV